MPSDSHDSPGFAVSINSIDSDEIRQPKWGIGSTPFGQSVIIWSSSGILALWLATTDPDQAHEFVISRHGFDRAAGQDAHLARPERSFERDDQAAQGWFDRIFCDKVTGADPALREQIPVVMRGTAFELLVWQALCDIPEGTVMTYAALAAAIGRPKAARAVGSAIGRNGIAVLIPCHRVVPGAGGVGQFRWGASVKRALIDREAG